MENSKLDNAPQLRGIYYIDLDDMEFKDTLKSIPHTTILVKHDTYASWISTKKTSRNGRTHIRDHEDLIAEKGFNSLSLYNLVHKLIPILQVMKSLDTKVAVDKDWEKLKKLRA